MPLSGGILTGVVAVGIIVVRLAPSLLNDRKVAI